MKLRILLIAVFAAGLLASIALASPPPGKGNASNTETSGTTTNGKNPGKVLVCHKVGNGKYVLVNVSKKSAPARLKRTGDVLAVNGTCPGPIQGHGATTTTTTP